MKLLSVFTVFFNREVLANVLSPDSGGLYKHVKTPVGKNILKNAQAEVAANSKDVFLSDTLKTVAAKSSNFNVAMSSESIRDDLQAHEVLLIIGNLISTSCAQMPKAFFRLV